MTRRLSPSLLAATAKPDRWRDQMRRRFLKPPFTNPYFDATDPRLWDEELDIVQRLLAGEELCESRHYVASRDTYGVYWYWNIHPNYPDQWDGPVTQLMSRGIIRSVRCGGGFTAMVLTDAALQACGRVRAQGDWGRPTASAPAPTVPEPQKGEAHA